MPFQLTGQVCIVTGATRGIGKGIALQLAKHGAKVYITGRTLDPPKSSMTGGCLRETAKEIEALGGTCVPVQCDHSKDDDIEKLFEQVKRENDGQLDILVNNAYSAVNTLSNQMGVKFWELPTTVWDEVNDVGLRNHYICSVYAARMMVPRKHGLIVNISSPGGLRYLFNCAYGIGKEACDRMAADCGFELKKHNVAFVSLWPGLVGTEEIRSKLSRDGDLPIDAIGDFHKTINTRNKMLEMIETCETTEFPGQCIVALATDPKIMQKSGKIVLTCDLGREYGLSDAEGHTPNDIRQVKYLFQSSGHTWMAALVPGFVRVPKWIMALLGNKFY